MGKKIFAISIAVLIIAVLTLLVVLNNSNSVQEVVNGAGTFKTWESALDSCNSQRILNAKSGQECEPCETTCPSDSKKQSNGLYNIEYGTSSAIYKGSFSNVKCDEISGGLLKVTSYCNDNIRLCQKQSGSGTVTATESISNGKIQTISYSYNLVDCNTGALYATTEAQKKAMNAVAYQLSCNNGYTVDGKRTAQQKSELGSCVSTKTDVSSTPLSGSFSQVSFDSRASTQEDVINKVIFTANEAGKYYVYSKVSTSSQALAIVTGTQDQCGDDMQTSGVFVTMTKDESKVIVLEVAAPKEAGTYNVKVGVRQGCNGADYDTQSASVVIYSPKELKAQVISQAVGDNSEQVDDYNEAVQDRYEQIKNLESCDGEDLTVDGCAVAECVDNKVRLFTDEEITTVCNEKSDAIKQAINKFSLSSVFDINTTRGKVVWASIGVILIAAVTLIVAVRKVKKQ